MSINKNLAGKDFVFIRKTANVWSITLPKHILDSLGWSEDTLLNLRIEDGKIVVHRAKLEVEGE